MVLQHCQCCHFANSISRSWKQLFRLKGLPWLGNKLTLFLYFCLFSRFQQPPPIYWIWQNEKSKNPRAFFLAFILHLSCSFCQLDFQHYWAVICGSRLMRGRPSSHSSPLFPHLYLFGLAVRWSVHRPVSLPQRRDGVAQGSLHVSEDDLSLLGGSRSVSDEDGLAGVRMSQELRWAWPTQRFTLYEDTLLQTEGTRIVLRLKWCFEILRVKPFSSKPRHILRTISNITILTKYIQ